jgi:hypothetical protein
LCTDGAGEKLVSNDGLKIAGSLSKIFYDTREEKFNHLKLHEFHQTKKYGNINRGRQEFSNFIQKSDKIG